MKNLGIERFYLSITVVVKCPRIRVNRENKWKLIGRESELIVFLECTITQDQETEYIATVLLLYWIWLLSAGVCVMSGKSKQHSNAENSHNSHLNFGFYAFYNMQIASNWMLIYFIYCFLILSMKHGF